MFALAMTLTFLDCGAAEAAPEIQLSFHATREDARNKLIENILANTQPHIKTLEDFLAELKAGGDLEKASVDFSSMSWEDTLQWIRVEAVGDEDDTHFSYKIEEVPA